MFTKICQCLEIEEVEADGLRQGGGNHLHLGCLFQSLHFSWRVQELGSHRRAEERVCDSLPHTARIFLHPVSPCPQGPSEYLVLLLPETGKLLDTLICLWSCLVEEV